MSDPAYSRIREVFHAVCELPDDERQERLIALCGDDRALRAGVERLLDASRRADETTMGFAGGSAPIDAQPFVKGFRVLRVLGEGGMGVVYEAEQEHPRRRVALKIIQPAYLSPRLERRFEREAEVLGRLKHAGIAQVYEATVGEINGRRTPYLVMELVEGQSLIKHAESASMGVRDRLELACRLCEAVEHAHQRGVIHRDLKPANIVVDQSGQPKILDFGIARITDSDVRTVTMQTEVGQILGTAAYMSPEQASGDPEEVDTRSDVYSLGVVIFELLAGRLPHSVERLALPDAIRVIREEEPTRVGSLVATLRGDVDTILAKALDREKERRYQSAAALGADIRRFLSDEPIVARAPSTIYQLQKFARRNKALVGGVCAVILALTAGLIATGVALEREGAARADAEEALARAGASSAFLGRVLSGLDPRQAQGRDTELLRDMLDRAAGSLDNEVSYPSVRAEMLATIGRAYYSIFEFDKAVASLAAADALYEGLGPSFESSLVDIRLVLADAYTEVGDRERAEGVFLAALEGAERRGNDAQIALALRQLAEFRMDSGQWSEALGLIERVLPLAAAERPIDEGRTELQHGAILRRLGRLEEAGEAYSRALSLFRGEDNGIEEASALNSLAVLARNEGRLDDAERLYRESIDRRLSVDPSPNPSVGVAMDNLGKLLVSQGRLDEAAPILEQSIEIHRRFYDEGHFSTAMPLMSLAGLEGQRGNHERAIELCREGLEIFRTTLPALHPFTATALSHLGNALIDAERYADAEAAFREGLEMATALRLSPQVYIGPLEKGLAIAIDGQGRSEEALALLRQALDRYDASDPTAEEIRGLIERVGASDVSGG